MAKRVRVTETDRERKRGGREGDQTDKATERARRNIQQTKFTVHMG